MNQKGMTLLEIMIVVAIIAGLLAVLAPNVISQWDKAKVKQGAIQLSNIQSALRNYYLDCGAYPSEDRGLEALLESPGENACPHWGPNPYLRDRKYLVDPFNHKFVYRNDGTKVSITFLGKDGREGGSGLNEDVIVEEEE